MKSNLAKVSLALLSAVFILGCQDLGTAVEGPEGLVPQFAKGRKGGGRTGPDVRVSVTVIGGMDTGTLQPQVMELAERDTRIKLRAQSGKKGLGLLEFAINMPMTRTNALENLARCSQTGKTAPNDEFAETLLDQLLQSPVEYTVLAAFDKTVSDDNAISIWGGNVGVIRMTGATATVEDDLATKFTVTFTGGTIDLTGVAEGEQNHLHLFCPILDDIAFTVEVV